MDVQALTCDTKDVLLEYTQTVHQRHFGRLVVCVVYFVESYIRPTNAQCIVTINSLQVINFNFRI